MAQFRASSPLGSVRAKKSEKSMAQIHSKSPLGSEGRKFTVSSSKRPRHLHWKVEASETALRLEVSPMDRKSKKHKQAKEPDKPKRKPANKKSSLKLDLTKENFTDSR